MCVQLQRLDHALGLAPRELRDAATREIVHELHSEPRVAGRDSSNACHVMVLSRGRRAARTKGRPSWPLVPGPQPIVVSTTACALTLYDGSRVTYVTGRVGLGQRGAEDVAAQRRRVVDDGERAGGKVRVRVSSDSLWTHGCHIGRAPFVISTDDAGEET